MNIIIAAYTEEAAEVAQHMGLLHYRTRGEQQSVGGDGWWWARKWRAREVLEEWVHHKDVKLIVGPGSSGSAIDYQLTQASYPWMLSFNVGLHARADRCVGEVQWRPPRFFLHEADFYRGDLSWCAGFGVGIELAWHQRRVLEDLGADLRPVRMAADADELTNSKYGDSEWNNLEHVPRRERYRMAVVAELAHYIKQRWEDYLP